MWPRRDAPAPAPSVDDALAAWAARQAATVGRRARTAAAPREAWMPRLEGAASGCLGVIRAGDVGLGGGVAVGARGRALFTGHSDGHVRRWDLENGQVAWTLKLHNEAFVDLDVSPDGRRFTVASRFRTVRVRDTETGDPVVRYDGHDAGVHVARFSPDGRRVATASQDGSVHVWDADTGRALARLVGHQGACTSVGWSPDGRRLATASEDRTVRVWSADDGREAQRLTGHAGGVLAVGWSPGGRLLASAGRDRTIRVWSAATGLPVHRLAGHYGEVTALAWSPGGHRLATGGEDHTVRVWDAETGAEIARHAYAEESVARVAWSPEGGFLASSHFGDVFRLWDPRPNVRPDAERRRATRAASPLDLPLAAAALWRRGRAVPLSLVRDLLDLTGGRAVEGPCARLAAHPGLRALASLRWPAQARIALAVLLLRDAHDPAHAPPEGATPSALRWHLTAALDAPECPPSPAPVGLLPVERALAGVDERLLTLLEGLGPDACARDPALPLTLLARLDEIVPLDAPQRRLLDLRLPAARPGKAVGAGLGAEPGGFAPHGDLRRLVPTQWVLPDAVRRWRHANGGLLYRTRLGHEPPRLRPTVLVLDVSPTCVGPVERVLRPAARALAAALLDAGVPAWLVAAGGDDLVRPLQHRLDLFKLLARRAAAPVDVARTLERARGLREALRDHGPFDPVVVLLTQPWFGAEERDVPAPPHLRALFVHYPGRPVRPAWHDRCERWACLPPEDPPDLATVLADLAG